MPSPIAHLAVGYVAYRIVRPKKPVEQSELSYHKATIPLLAATLCLSMLPDLDILPGILVGNFGRFHNTITNSVVVGLGISAFIGGIGRTTGWYRWRPAFLLALISYLLHIFMDFSTGGRGVMLLWPFSAERFTSPIQLFYGVRWSQGWITWHHLWTVTSELALLTAVVGAGIIALRFWHIAQGD
ncbi:MAG: metal-dependent hydrolase [Anaerolineae bacterium]|nr:metal-dependent hydrolase [Anaerolineae bacterium]MCO5189916.1 metal-dependent hydrolase [Anaerolineae bacterium]